MAERDIEAAAQKLRMLQESERTGGRVDRSRMDEALYSLRAAYAAHDASAGPLTFAAYTAERLAARGERLSERDTLVLGGLGVGGEAGEVAELIKKHLFHGRSLDRDKVVEELGDVLWYVMYIADAVGSTLEEVARVNNEKLRERYPTGFSAAAAAARAVGAMTTPTSRVLGAGAQGKSPLDPLSAKCSKCGDVIRGPHTICRDCAEDREP